MIKQVGCNTTFDCTPCIVLKRYPEMIQIEKLNPQLRSHPGWTPSQQGLRSSESVFSSLIFHAPNARGGYKHTKTQNWTNYFASFFSRLSPWSHTVSHPEAILYPTHDLKNIDVGIPNPITNSCTRPKKLWSVPCHSISFRCHGELVPPIIWYPRVPHHRAVYNIQVKWYWTPWWNGTELPGEMVPLYNPTINVLM